MYNITKGAAVTQQQNSKNTLVKLTTTKTHSETFVSVPVWLRA